jgi:hypothetical protein
MNPKKKLTIQIIAVVVLTAATIISLSKPKGTFAALWIAATVFLFLVDLGIFANIVSDIVKSFKKDKDKQ